ncbi:tetratricopeptide repeat protein [Congregibacter litoralis]|uniref:Tetratricopeptide repeat protein n=1 Tax=Congregibacter litoralis KT71 TaxID=314285 RepID=A4A599_9GAMM|nr:tetratricopeptide repeat protein [Congregibacter litoralis]EAQ98970.1 Tetratricopeptide repeat protein [Congregibacter litoralis KT71]
MFSHASFRRLFLIPALLSSLALVGGCAGTDRMVDTAEPNSDDPVVAAATDAVKEPPPPPVPERPIPEASVYPLLLAEFALRRRDFDTALNTYLEQADVLQDPAVSAHATHLAQYLQREREAFRAVRLWVALEPDNIEANGTLATLLARQGRNREALPYLATVARAGEKAKFPVLLNRYKALRPADQLGLDSDTQALLDDDLGDDVSLRLTHALMAEERGDAATTRARLAPVFALKPYQRQALILEAKLNLAEGIDEPLARMEEALDVDPTRTELRLQYARLLASQDMAAAREQFEILSAEAPHNADLLFSLALISHELEDNEAAKGYLQQIIALNQRRDEAYLFLGQIARSEDDLDEAIQLFQQVGDGAELMKATISIAQIQVAEGREQELADYMDRLRQSYPPRKEQLYALEANIYSETDHDEKGLELLNRAIDEFPESDNLRYARSVAHEKAGNIAAAETDLRDIIERDPDNATALNALGYTLANSTDRYDEARVLIEKALALSPNEPSILDSMGWVLYHHGDLENAKEYLTRAYAAFPDPEVAAHLGEVLWAIGNTTGAMTVWRAALVKDPQHGVLNETLTRLGISLQADADS